ncbi:MAG: acyl-CoA dehydrogenase family protein [Deltaproteobacteria bacterium]|nr:acyl-CoA dehydrogenase family protein [Deltaproteobacteria bacterium]MBW2404788.1 acyl-CoA dehydrogenase family protein [Deltaproteobacteria bacterium]MBW2548378.1 acyl-CoA dehydrogenase family protein [Deltaproteobacteria bacterium]
MDFRQAPPTLGNQYDSDPLLREYLERTLPPDLLTRFEPEYRELGELSGGELFQLSLADLDNEPVHTVWDAWGNRIDHVEVTEVWKRAQVICAEHGLVAAGYDSELGPYARVHQHVLNYVAQASLDTYNCPLAMTDGAARTLLDSGNQALIDHALPRLLSRDPERMWTSGQWMTESIGGSDVGQTETVARRDGDRWRLYGTKWFTSATTADMALTLARPEGNSPGGRGLAMFYLELRDENGQLQNLRINRLKDKLGTRKLPTAELTLDGVEAIPVAGLENGVRSITPMLTITRTWNAVGATLGMQRAVALTRDYASKREAFGAALIDKPLHVDTMAEMVAETQGAFLLTFRVVELLGRIESGEATEADQLVSRLLTPIAKLTTGKQGVAVASEALEGFGGAGYVNDTGLPKLLADAQVLPIWEGTTNVLSLDTLRALQQGGGWEAFVAEIQARLDAATDSRLRVATERGAAAVQHAGRWLQTTLEDRPVLEAGARRFAMTLGRATELALLADHAQWCLDQGKGERALAAARRFARSRIDLIEDDDFTGESELLVG